MWRREGSLANGAEGKRKLALSVPLRTSEDVKALAQRGSKRSPEGAWDPLGSLNREEIQRMCPFNQRGYAVDEAGIQWQWIGSSGLMRGPSTDVGRWVRLPDQKSSHGRNSMLPRHESAGGMLS